MREIDVKAVEQIIYQSCGKIAVYYPEDILNKLSSSCAEEKTAMAKQALQILLDNGKIASDTSMPICQDTGMIIVFLQIGQDVHFVNGNLNQAIQDGVRNSYHDNYLRNSVVSDPVYERVNTLDNTPAIIYCDIVPGDQVKIEILAKGFGSENMSAIKMLKPAQGEDGVIDFVLDIVSKAGPNACPPMIVGIGIGGDFEKAAMMSKHALLRPLDSKNDDAKYQTLEATLLKKINELDIGPLGLGGQTTALKVMIEQMPTHIAGLPVAVNICCHACRHITEVL